VATLPYFRPVRLLPSRRKLLVGKYPKPSKSGKERERMANRKRLIVLRCPVTEQERDLIQQKMAQIPTKNFAAYARKMLIDGYVVKVDYSELKAVTAEIQKIGANVNQIAKRVNATGNVYEQDIAEIKGALAEIWRLQRLSLLKAP
jgi:SepF-like predicted cell division protein (DUF552 family)